MRLSHLLDMATQRRQLQIPVGTETLTAVYDNRVITPAFLGAFSDPEQNAGALPAAVTSLVVEWDLTDEAGQPLPLSAETLRELPVPVLYQILAAVLTDYREQHEQTAPRLEGR